MSTYCSFDNSVTGLFLYIILPGNIQFWAKYLVFLQVMLALTFSFIEYHWFLLCLIVFYTFV